MNQKNIKDLKIKRQGEFDYTITIQQGFENLSSYLSVLEIKAKKVCVVTDSNVSQLYLEDVKTILKEKFDLVCEFIFTAGEESKHLGTVENLYQQLIKQHFQRNDLLIALGGGVVGDLTGYVAATYLRGIDFIQVPTTLLAQVDSSIGGKTGVDFKSYKNMIGAFHQPLLVYMNLSALNTLDEQQFSCGMGEVLKTALIRDAKLYEWVITNLYEIMERDFSTLSYMIYRCCAIKRDVVEEDPKEQGVRAILNLGHTIGHAIEKLKDFNLLHGQCVALGTVAAAYLSHKKGFLSTEELYEIRDMNVGFDLPIMVDGLDANTILEVTKLDKKMEQNHIKFILLKSIGKAVIGNSITDDELLDAINFIRSETYEGQ